MNSGIHHNIHLVLQAEVHVRVIIVAPVDLPSAARDNVSV